MLSAEANPDAADVPGQSVGILRHHPHGVVSIRLVDSRSARRPDTVAVQKDHDFPHDLLLVPSGSDPFCPNGSDPGHFAQAPGLVLDHCEDLVAELCNEPFRIFRTYALNRARPKVFLDALMRRGLGRRDVARLELPAVRPVDHPIALGRDPLAGIHRRCAADDGLQFALAARAHPEHAKAVVGVVKDHVLDHAGQELALVRVGSLRHLV